MIDLDLDCAWLWLDRPAYCDFPSFPDGHHLAFEATPKLIKDNRVHYAMRVEHLDGDGEVVKAWMKAVPIPFDPSLRDEAIGGQMQQGYRRAILAFVAEHYPDGFPLFDEVFRFDWPSDFEEVDVPVLVEAHP